MGTAEVCPKCGGGAIRRSSSLLRHWQRLLSGSAKRFCAGCGEKWRVERAPQEPVLRKEEKAVVLAVFAASLLFALATHPHALQDMIRRHVRSYYEERYGPDAEVRMWRDFGKLYGPKPAAVKDYGKKPPGT
jgi:hypothetical protein